MRSVASIALAFTLAGCWYLEPGPPVSIARGEFPVAVERRGDTVWLLTESYDAQNNGSDRAVHLYRVDASNPVEAVAVHDWQAIVPVYEMGTEPLVAALDWEKEDEAPRVWVLSNRSGEIGKGSLQRFSVTEPAVTVPVSLEMMLGWPVHSHRLTTLRPRPGVLWMWFTNTHLLPDGANAAGAGPTFLPFLEITGASAAPVQDGALWAECDAATCRMLTVAGQFTIYATPVSATAWQAAKPQKLPETPSEPGLFVACPDARRAQTTLFLPHVNFTWSRSVSEPVKIHDMPTALRPMLGELKEFGYLICPHGDAPPLMFDIERRLWAVDLKADTVQRLDGSYGRVPDAPGREGHYPDHRVEGYVMHSAGLEDSDRLLAYGILTDTKKTGPCTSYGGPFEECYIHTYRTAVTVLDHDGNRKHVYLVRP